LLIFMALASLAFAWVHQARQQHSAVEALNRSNPSASVFYDDRAVSERGGSSEARNWLRVALFVGFAGLLTTEWALRRHWQLL
jgi:hypothetical protein